MVTDIFSTVGVANSRLRRFQREIIMARSEDGEFELILGNRQLLSVFFIIVVLLGVFFTMGYIVGKNSVSADVLAAKKTDPLMLDPTKPQPEPGSGEIIVPKPLPGEQAKPADLPPRRTPDETEPLVLQPKTPEVAAQKPEPQKKENPQTGDPGAARSRPPSFTATGDPAPGQTFLQVVASTRQDCEIIADILNRKGLTASLVPGPSPSLFRVLVGPLQDSAAISKAREDLEQAGFSKPYLRKY